MGGIIGLLLGVLVTATSAFSTSVSAFSHSDFQRLVDAGVQPQALRVALRAYYWAEAKGDVKRHVLTLVDFTQPSTQKRLWVINMNNGDIIYNGLVAHGKGSGDLYATHFSDQPGSDASVLGALVTGNTYDGKHGLSVKIHGLEKGLNTKVYNRAVVFHSAWYATSSFAQAHDYLGRSWGCFAISPKESNYVFNQIKGGSFVFAYAVPENHDPNFS